MARVRKDLGNVVGADGKSAYQIWLEQGNAGTEQDFIKSLIGKDGKGISKIEKTATVGLIDTYTITYTDGTTSTYEVKNGANGTGEGGTSDYPSLENLPSINGVLLTGNKTTEDLRINIPTNTSELVNDSGFITGADIPTVPTKTSELENDSGFVNEEDVNEIISGIDIQSSSVPVEDIDANNTQIEGKLSVEGDVVKLTCDREYTIIHPSGTLNTIALDGKTYKEIFEDNNVVFCNGFDDDSFPNEFTVQAGSPSITNEAYNTEGKSLKCFSSTVTSQVIKGGKIGASAPFFMAAKVKIDSYTSGYLGMTSFDKDYGVVKNAVTNGFETIAGIVTSYNYANNPWYIGSFGQPVLEGYIDDPVIVPMSYFTNTPTESELKTAYETYLLIKKGEAPTEPTEEIISGTFEYILTPVTETEEEEESFTDSECRTKFIEYMNNKATQLGMTDTVYYDSIGLNINNRMSTSDYAKLLRYALSCKPIATSWNVQSHTVNVMGNSSQGARKFTVSNSIIPNAGATTPIGVLNNAYHIYGGKGGSLTLGYNGGIVGYNTGLIIQGNADIDNKVLLAVVFGTQNNSTRYTSVKTIIDEAIAHYKNPESALNTENWDCASATVAILPPYNGVMYNINSEIEDIVAYNNTTPYVPASTTKTMTFACLEDLGFKPDDKLEYTQADADYLASTGLSSSGTLLYPGDIITYTDAVHALMMESNNYIACMFARIGGEKLLKSMEL